MRCPFCRHEDSRVVDSRVAEDGVAIRRRRLCPSCERRFTTVELATLHVVKRSGVVEPFSRQKVMAGVRKACQGRPVDEDAVELLAQRVEELVRASGRAEIPSQEVGLAILAPLRDLDLVAYLRFASVYRAFDCLEDFEKEIRELRDAAEPAVPSSRSPGPDPAGATQTGSGQSGPGPSGHSQAGVESGTGQPAPAESGGVLLPRQRSTGG